MHTPGHSPGGICLLDREAGVLFTGDTVYDSRLFDELPGSDINSYLMTISRLRSLPGIRMVCPGHDDCFDGDRLRELCDASCRDQDDQVAARAVPCAGWLAGTPA
jgi:glyoxylase-like metal-dependent hydrolase (beta-lactamase superfamily II)